MKLFFTLWMLLLFAYSGRAQLVAIENNDSLLRVIQTEKANTATLKELEKLITKHIDFGIFDKADTLIYWARKLALRLNEPKSLVLTYYFKGTISFYQYELALAFETFIEGLKIAEKYNDPYSIGLCKTSIGRVLNLQDEKGPAWRYFEESLKIFTAIKSKEGLCYLHNCMGNSFLTVDDAEKHFRIANQLARETSNHEMEARTLVNLGVVYRERKEYPSSTAYFFKGLELFEKIGNLDRITWVNLLIGENYSRENKNDLALKYLALSKELALKGNLKYYLSDIYQLISNVMAQKKDFASAYAYRLSYEKAQDSLKVADNQKKIKTIELQYLFEKQKESERVLQEQKDVASALLRNILLGALGIFVLFTFVFLFQRNKIRKEKRTSDELLENILPAQVAQELKDTGSAKAKSYNNITVMFADIQGFTQISERLTAEELVAEIDFCFKALDKIIAEHGLEKIKTIGDAYMCAGGLPKENYTHAQDTIRAAIAIQSFMQQQKIHRKSQGKEFFELRIGIHTGNVVAGIVGLKKFAYDIWGDAVNTASRMESNGETGKINISQSTYALVKDQFECTSRGKIMVKGKGEMDMYFVSQKAIYAS